MKKAFTLIEIMIVVVIIGLLAIMAVPAFNKVRTQAQTKAISANLKQVVVVGHQYMLTHALTEVGYTQLVEGKSLTPFTPIAGEKYSRLNVVKAGSTLATVGNGNLRVVFTY